MFNNNNIYNNNHYFSIYNYYNNNFYIIYFKFIYNNLYIMIFFILSPTDCLLYSQLISVTRHLSASNRDWNPTDMVSVEILKLSLVERKDNFYVLILLLNMPMTDEADFMEELCSISNSSYCLQIGAFSEECSTEIKFSAGLYIVIHRQSVSLYHNSSIRPDIQ